jgi:polysaccharide pyruvyl transferase CsaB
MRDIITILGWYGSGNAGDESILLALLSLLKKNYPDCEIVVISHRPNFINQTYGLRSINVNDFRNIFLTLLKSELFILGGGGLIKPGSVGYYSTILSIANCLSSKSIVYSIGAIPITSLIDRLLILLSFTFCDYVSVRDTFSKNILRNLGINRVIFVTRDPVFGHIRNGSKNNYWIDEMKPYITVCLRQWDHSDLIHSGVSFSNTYENFLSSLSIIMTCLVKSGYNIVYLPLMVNLLENDVTDHKNLLSIMNNNSKMKLITNQLDPDSIINILANSEFVLGMRYHSIVFSLISGVPVIALAYADKVTSLMQDLKLGSFCINIKNDFHNETIIQVKNIMKHRNEIKIMIYKQLETQRAIINKHDQLLLKIVKRFSFKRGVKNCISKIW